MCLVLYFCLLVVKVGSVVKSKLASVIESHAWERYCHQL
jgi:hypothetical protein